MWITCKHKCEHVKVWTYLETRERAFMTYTNYYHFLPGQTETNVITSQETRSLLAVAVTKVMNYVFFSVICV